MGVAPTRLFITTVDIEGNASISAFHSLCSSQGTTYGLGSQFQALVGRDSNLWDTYAYDQVPIFVKIANANGSLLASDVTSLFSKNLWESTTPNPYQNNPILFPDGTYPTGCPLAWFGGTPSGDNKIGATCSSWTSTTGQATVGDPCSVNGTSSRFGDNLRPCNSSLRLYCVEKSKIGLTKDEANLMIYIGIGVFLILIVWVISCKRARWCCFNQLSPQEKSDEELELAPQPQPAHPDQPRRSRICPRSRKQEMLSKLYEQELRIKAVHEQELAGIKVVHEQELARIKAEDLRSADRARMKTEETAAEISKALAQQVSQNKALQEQLAEVAQRVQDLRVEAEQAQVKEELLTKGVQALEAEKTTLKEQLDRVLTESGILKRERDELQGLKGEMDETRKNLQQERDTARKELTEEKDTARKGLQELTEERDELRKDLQRMTTSLNERDRDVLAAILQVSVETARNASSDDTVKFYQGWRERVDKSAYVVPPVPTICNTELRTKDALGGGIEGLVLRADWVRDGKKSTVAWKMPHKQGRLKGEKEAELWKACPPHPNLITLRAKVEDPDGLFQGAVMDLCSKSLDNVKLEPSEALNCARQIARGLAHLHACKILHRDLAPRNLLLQLLSDGSTRYTITDFGLSRLMDRNYVYLRGANGAALPMHLLAPEIQRAFLKIQASDMDEEEKENAKIEFGKPSDMWALGVTLWELATGKKPYSEFNYPPSQLQEMIGKGHAKLNLDVLIPTHRDLAPAIIGCLQNAPDKRPTAAQVLLLLNDDPRLAARAYADYMELHYGSAFSSSIPSLTPSSSPISASPTRSISTSPARSISTASEAGTN